MKQTLLVGFVLTVLGFADYAVAQQAQERAEAPVYKDGECWVFRVVTENYFGTSTQDLPSGDYEVCYFKEGHKVFRLENGQKTEVSQNTVTLKSMFLTSDRKLVDLPLFKGKKWPSEYRTGAGPRGMTMTGTNEVVGEERIAVPGGEFNSFKIERWETGSISRWSSTYYYSSAVKVIVKYSLQSTAYSGAVMAKREVELLKAPAHLEKR